MAIPALDIDFEGNGNPPQPNPNNDDAQQLNEPNPNDPANLNDNHDNDNPDDNHDNDNPDEGNKNNNNSSTGGLEPGTSLTIDDVEYTVNDNGDIVDKDGNVFKPAAEVADWLKEQQVDDANDDAPLDINSIIETVGVNVTDNEGKTIEFTNDAAGVKAYLDNVMELRTKDIQDATLNKLFDDAPIVKDFIDYLTINGSPRGFGEIRDLSGITLDKENENQLEQVIRAAAKEFGNTTLSESYIKYLKDSGGLYDEANKQLQAMIDRDNAEKAEREENAKLAREEHRKQVEEYWNNVSKQIQSKEIAGYKIPDSLELERDGRKIIVTPNDFYNYLTIPNRETGLTGYRQDLENMSDNDVMQHELLDAWLHFTGRSYKDLVNMALKEEKVKQLRITSKNNQTRHTVKITKKEPNKVDLNSIVLG